MDSCETNEGWAISSISGEDVEVPTTRASYRVFPIWTSRFWTWLTGKPDCGEKAILKLTPFAYAVWAVLTYVAGLALATGAGRLHGAWCITALFLGWVLAVNGARRMVSTVAHQCIHRRFTGNIGVDMAVANCMAILTLTQSAKHYHDEHFRRHHHHAIFSSLHDPAGEFLLRAGFRPGLSIRSLWVRLFVAMISPRFHGIFLWSRLRSLFLGLSWKARCVGIILWSAIFAAALGSQPTSAGIFAIIVPVTVIYQNSVLLEFISEHAWFAAPKDLTQPKYIHATHSWGRFCGRRTPQRGAKSRLTFSIDWMIWSLEHLFYHLPTRLVILPGDLSQHDFHHRNPATLQWTEAAFARENDIANGDTRWPPYQEFWGLHTAIFHVFDGISKVRP